MTDTDLLLYIYMFIIPRSLSRLLDRPTSLKEWNIFSEQNLEFNRTVCVPVVVEGVCYTLAHQQRIFHRGVERENVSNG